MFGAKNMIFRDTLLQSLPTPVGSCWIQSPSEFGWKLGTQSGEKLGVYNLYPQLKWDPNPRFFPIFFRCHFSIVPGEGRSRDAAKRWPGSWGFADGLEATALGSHQEEPAPAGGWGWELELGFLGVFWPKNTVWLVKWNCQKWLVNIIVRSYQIYQLTVFSYSGTGISYHWIIIGYTLR